MRTILVSLLTTLLLSACAVWSEAGKRESVLFAEDDNELTKPQAVLAPYEDFPLSIQFSCPMKRATAMSWYFFPLPPVIPVGFLNEHVSYLRIKVPEDAQHTIGKIQVQTGEGQQVSLPEQPESRRVTDNGKTVETTYELKKDCETLDGGSLQVASFSYKDREYPPSEAQLKLDSKPKLSIRYAPF
ncbi:hypothetical protein [Noviherbaspirillum massiliense]|uniref:hypothetical protein n=1 Tax=Noviherbaspirillum massiliense TaxID=1465823 RepID=UPI00030DA60D|nr:hypothetical protein [Noviherbaspirillum massiliense]